MSDVFKYNPLETRHCDACGHLGHVGGMLHQPGNIWVHPRCATPHSKWGTTEAHIREKIAEFRATHPNHPLQTRSDKRLLLEV